MPEPDTRPRLREMTVGDLLDEAAARWPDAEALVYSAYEDLDITVRWSFAELRERSCAVARAFVASGLERGDRVGIWATNRPEWVLVQFGAAYAGIVLVPLNPLYRAPEVAYVLGRAGASACILEPEDRGSNLWEILASASPELPSLRLRVAIGTPGDGGGLSLDEWIDGGRRIGENVLEARRAAVRPGDTSQIQFTSGTTGFPKGAELRHIGLANNARLFAHRAGLHEGSRHCNPMPFFHCGGCVQCTLGSVATGATHLPTLTFDAKRVAATIEQERATSVSLVPTMMVALEEEVEGSGQSLQSLDVVVTGGAPVPVDLERRWQRLFGVRFSICYGMTEASPVITQSSPNDPEKQQLATCGLPLPHVEVDIVAPGSVERVRVGEQGELRTRGIMVMNGYWGDAEATGGAIDSGGWLRTGDLATMDAAGYVSITGRAKEMILRGGENIYPAEIEDALRRLPAVQDASVIGVPDERYGEQVAAFVRLSAGASMTEHEMREQLAPLLARYKIPRYLMVVDAFPVTPSGKVQKFRLRDEFINRRRLYDASRGESRGQQSTRRGS